MSLRCKFKGHKNKLVAVNDDYTSTFTDTGKKIKWQLRFYECAVCKRRHFKHSVSEYGRYYTIDDHAGVKKAYQNWIDAGVVPSNSYDPADPSTGFVRPGTVIEPDDPLHQINKSLQEIASGLAIILRDQKLEEKYPKLKKAADEYNKQLDKYKNFETLKGNNDV